MDLPGGKTLNHIIMKKLLFLLPFLGLNLISSAQDDLLNMIDSGPKGPEPVKATFKTTRIVNGHSIEQMAAKHLDFRINHRFGYINSGADQFFGLDYARIRLGLEYGLTDKLMIGIGRNNVGNKAFDYFAKYKLFAQTNTNSMPLTVSLFASASTDVNAEPGYDNLTDRTNFCYQVLLARKFSEAVSLQFTPSLIHRNLTESKDYKNDIFSLGVGGRIKLTRRTSFNFEYFHLFNPDQVSSEKLRNNLSLGFDIETGGHVFQLFLTNSYGMIEKDFVAAANSDWGKGDISYGFNISRTFSFKK